MNHAPLSRRAAVHSLLAAITAPALIAACGRSSATRSQRFAVSPVRVEPDRVIRQVVGLRPFRRNGFRVEAESWSDKTIIHNYGHGGGGVTLSWGTAMLACELAQATSHRRAAVIGCGAVGLATARLLQDRGIPVTIYARDLPPNTTSNTAGAQWAPVMIADEDRRTAHTSEASGDSSITWRRQTASSMVIAGSTRGWAKRSTDALAQRHE